MVRFAEPNIPQKSSKKQERRQTSPCCRVQNKRLLSMGAGFEQRPWTPTVRRGRIAAEAASPGPACVQLPNLVGTKVTDSKKQASPAFSFGQKHRCKDDSIGPGPAQYNVSGLGVKGKDTPPAMSLQSRPKQKTTFKTPAPGEYNVDKAAKSVVDSAPRYTFGYRQNLEKTSTTPAPNVYRIPTVLGSSKDGTIKSAPAFSMTGRQKPRVSPTLFVPGPGTYDGEYQIITKKSPMYSMGIKHKGPTDEHLKPGPGAHCPEKSYITKKSIPTQSFSIRHSEYLGVRKAYLIPLQLERCLIQTQ